MIGLPRSGTHHAKSVLSNVLSQQNVEFIDIGEVGAIDPRNELESDWTILSGQLDMAETTNYIVASMPNLVGPLFSPTVLSHFHVIKLIRKDLWAHFKSLMIFETAMRHPGLVNNSVVNKTLLFEQVNFPIKVTAPRMIGFVTSRMVLLSMASDEVVFYEDIEHISSDSEKSTVDQSPSELFSNFQQLDITFSNLSKIHGW